MVLTELAQGRVEGQGAGLEWRKGLCGICPAGCWVEVGLRDGKLVDIRPDASHTLGTICRRGQHAPEIVYSEHRLRYPLRRAGPKGSYEFERITWDEAYRIIVENLNRVKAESGPEPLAKPSSSVRSEAWMVLGTLLIIAPRRAGNPHQSEEKLGKEISN